MPEGPLLLDSAPAPPAGTAALQWHWQDGSWQDPASWSVHPSLLFSMYLIRLGLDFEVRPETCGLSRRTVQNCQPDALRLLQMHGGIMVTVSNKQGRV